jgi:hypothetical protein
MLFALRVFATIRRISWSKELAQTGLVVVVGIVMGGVYPS